MLNQGDRYCSTWMLCAGIKLCASINIVDPDFGGQKPSMFICGDNADAKQEAGEITEILDFEAEDMGGSEASGAIESLCILWCIPGFQRGGWHDHAFKLLKK